MAFYIVRISMEAGDGRGNTHTAEVSVEGMNLDEAVKIAHERAEAVAEKSREQAEVSA